MPYGTLVLLTSVPRAEDIRALREHEALANVEVDVVGVDPDDFMGCLSEAVRVIGRHARDRVVVHVAGGPNLLTSALLLAAFERGVEAFFCHPHGVSRLPVAVEVDLAERFRPAERAVLLALPPSGVARVPGLRVDGLTDAAVKGALLRLRRGGLVSATHEVAALTPAGAHYREHFVGP